MTKKKVAEWDASTAPCPFENDEFSKIWETLLGMPKWKKKPLSAIQLACNRLKRFELDFAAILVENAIEGNYQGVVFTNSEQQYENWKLQKQRLLNGQQSSNLRQSVNQEFAARDYSNRKI